MTANRRGDDRGFSLLVLLVGVVIVGLVATVVVIGLRSRNTPPTAAECEDDRAALQRAEDELHTKHGRYGTEAELVDAGFIEHLSSLHDVSLGTDSYSVITTGRCRVAATAASVASAPTARLAFGTVPPTVTAGRFIDPPITVTLTDEGGTVLADSSTDVTISLQSANGASVLGTTTVRAVAGVATFSGLAIDKAGTGYTFTATAAGAQDVSSSQLSVEPGSIAKLRFVAAPDRAAPAALFATQPVVEVEDVMGNVIVGAVDPVVLAIARHTGPRGAQLACDNLSVVPIGGVATFTGCRIDRAGVDYSLAATAPGLNAISTTFPVIGEASQLVIVQQPEHTIAGETLQPLVVAVEDSAGNVVTDSAATVSVSLDKNASALSGTTSVAVVDGVATFADLAVVAADTQYTLTAKTDGLHSATTAPFDVLTGLPTQLVFTRQPSGGKAGKSWSTQPIVTFADALGNVVASSDEITLQLTPGTGTPDALLFCTANPLAPTNGEARFFKCYVDRPGTDFTLTATSGALTGVSAPFSIT